MDFNATTCNVTPEQITSFMPQLDFFEEITKFGKKKKKELKVFLPTRYVPSSVTRFGNLLDFEQLFNVFGNN